MDSTTLTIYYQNCRGLRTKVDDFYANCSNQNHDIICLSETWLNDVIENDKLFDDRYTIYRRDRDYERLKQALGGGVLIAIKRNLFNSAEHRLHWNSNAEDIWVTLSFTNRKIHLCVAYFDPNISVTTLQSHLSILRYVSDNYSSNDIILVIGDYNLSQLFDIKGIRTTSNSQKYLEFYKTLGACHFQQYSRVCNTNSNILDLVLSNHNVNVKRKLEPFLVQEDQCHPTLEIRIAIDHSGHSSRHTSNSTPYVYPHSSNMDSLMRELLLMFVGTHKQLISTDLAHNDKEQQKTIYTEKRAGKRLLSTNFDCPISGCKRHFTTEDGCYKHITNFHKIQLKPEFQITETEIGETSQSPKSRKISHSENSLQSTVNSGEKSTQNVSSQTNNDASNNSYAAVYQLVKLQKHDTVFVDINQLLFKLCDTKLSCWDMTQDVVRSNIKLMAEDVEGRLLHRIQTSRYYALQMAEIILVNDFLIILVIVRYKFMSRIHEDLLLSLFVDSSIDGFEIFQIINGRFEKSNVNWKNCIGISVGCMSQRLEDFKKCLLNYTNIRFTTNFSDRVSFLKTQMSKCLRSDLNVITKIINQHKTGILKFSDPDINSKYEQVYLQTDDLWLAYTNTLSYFFSLTNKLGIESTSKRYNLACLIDLFAFFNAITKEIIEESNSSIFSINNKIKAMIEKLTLLKMDCKKNNFSQFPNVAKFMAENMEDVVDVSVLSRTLSYLTKNLSQYLLLNKEDEMKFKWILDPFTESALLGNIDVDETNKLINLQNDSAMRSEFNTEKKLELFWIKALRTKHRVIAERASRFLLNFSNCRLLESCVVTLINIRGNKLTDYATEESYLRLNISPIKPNFV